MDNVISHSNTGCRRLLFWIPVTIGIMLFLTGSSPFLKYMDVDSSVFYTMGRAMAEEKVPYRDLFDHKGWYIYLFNCLGALISPNNTVGLFVIECLFMLANVYLIYIIVMLINDDLLRINLTMSFMLFFLFNFITYQHGNLVETYGVTFQLISVYFVVKYYLSHETEHPPVYMLIHGVCVAVMLGLRANLAAMWVPIAVLILWGLLVNRKFKNAGANILSGMLGLILGFSPMLLYGAYTHSLKDMFQQSILFNLAYADGGKLRLFSLFTSAKTSWVVYLSMISLCLVIFSGYILKFKVLYTACLLISLYSVALSGRNYGHYYEYLVPFLLPVIFAASRIFSKVFSKKLQCAAIPIILLLTLMVSYPSTLHSYSYTQMQRYAQPVNEFSTLYKQKYSNKKAVLAVNNNAVIYNSFGVIPQEKYFYIPSISYSKFPEPIDSQAESILSGRNDIVVIKYRDYKKKKIFQTSKYDTQIKTYLKKNYTLVDENKYMEMYIKKE